MTNSEGMTVRRRIVELLESGFLTAKEISKAVSIKEKEVCEHLPHIARSVEANKNLKFVVEPSECLSCGFVFKKRERYTSPSRCPICRSEEITMPRFCVVDKDKGAR